MIHEEQSNVFWSNVENFMKLEKMRLIFAADKIPDSLQRIIEFLGRHFPDIDVYGVEIGKYSAENQELLSTSFISAPKVEGKINSHANWTMEQFYKLLEAHDDGCVINPLNAILNFCRDNGCDYKFGCGTKYPSISINLHQKNLLFIWAGFFNRGFRCYIEIDLKKHAMFLDSIEWNEQRLRALLSDMPGRDEGYSSGLMWDSPQTLFINLKLLKNNENLNGFLNALTILMQAINNRLQIE